MQLLSRPWTSLPTARVVCAVWLTLTLTAVVQAFVPKKFGGGEIPWSMFSRSGLTSSRVVAEGRVNGQWQALPLDHWFEYRRGMTEFRLPDESPVLMGADRAPKARARFADWLAQRAAADGIAVDGIRLRRQLTHIETGASRWVELGTYEVAP